MPSPITARCYRSHDPNCAKRAVRTSPVAISALDRRPKVAIDFLIRSKIRHRAARPRRCAMLGRMPGPPRLRDRAKYGRDPVTTWRSARAPLYTIACDKNVLKRAGKSNVARIRLLFIDSYKMIQWPNHCTALRHEFSPRSDAGKSTHGRVSGRYSCSRYW